MLHSSPDTGEDDSELDLDKLKNTDQLTDPKEVLAIRKRAGIPEVDPDARASTYANKMTDCISKRRRKLNVVLELYQDLDPITAKQTQFLGYKNRVLQSSIICLA